MSGLAARPIMLSMTRQDASSRVLLIAQRPTAAPQPAPVPLRRYRLARLRFESRPAGPDARFEHLKRVYD
jgi:hypothetical protein